MAAQFLSVGQTTFRKNVAARIYPQPIREGGRVFWARVQLEKFVESQFDMSHAVNEGESTWADCRQ